MEYARLLLGANDAMALLFVGTKPCNSPMQVVKMMMKLLIDPMVKKLFVVGEG